MTRLVVKVEYLKTAFQMKWLNARVRNCQNEIVNSQNSPEAKRFDMDGKVR